ncbi:hypothetical protein Golomagni_04594 [Golovinomyces magnicellulatus]|nr:hypothetical protein Golomagni_04594 [Golovinomyces magnicellulatus]
MLNPLAAEKTRQNQSANASTLLPRKFVINAPKQQYEAIPICIPVPSSILKFHYILSTTMAPINTQMMVDFKCHFSFLFFGMRKKSNSIAECLFFFQKTGTKIHTMDNRP